MTLKEYFKDRLLNALMEQSPPKLVRSTQEVTDNYNDYQNMLAKREILKKQGDRRYDSIENIRAGMGYAANSPRATMNAARERDAQRKTEEKQKK